MKTQFKLDFWLGQTLQALFAGAAHAMASSSIAGLASWLQFPALAWLALVVARAPTVKRAAWLGWLFAFAWLTGSFWWVYISMHDYGGLPVPMAGFALCFLSGGLALITAIAMALVRKASKPGVIEPLVFAAAWLFAELMRGWIFTGFPWAASGYAQVDSWLATYAPWLGVYGVGFVIALFCASSARFLQCLFGNRKTLPSLALYMLLPLVLYGLHWPLQRNFTSPAGTVKVALLQGNIAQELKFTEDARAHALDWYLKEMVQARQKGAQLIITPEIAIPYFVIRRADGAFAYLPEQAFPQEQWRELRMLFATGNTAALVGVPLFNQANNKQTNAMLGLQPGAAIYEYDKYHLVPFGEFIPWGFHWFVEMMNIPLGDFDRGTLNAPSMAWLGQRIAPNICYEDLFGEELAQRFRYSDQAPTVMVNASNIAWFGNTIALPQHLQIARMRSLELQRPMIRATNTGVTAIIDAQGAVVQMLEPYTAGTLYGEVQGREGVTLYAAWASRFGLLPFWVFSVAVIAFFLWCRRKSR